MSEDKRWQFELEEYIRQGEPGQVEKSEAWKTAIGLQDVDGLKTSAYLLSTAKDHIEGKISIDDAQKRIQTYYEKRDKRADVEEESREADVVAARIAKLLGEKTFRFSPAEWISIHRRLFDGILIYAGRTRTYNITKKEWVLKGDTVLYSSWESIKETMDYDFLIEKQFSYKGLSQKKAVEHLSKFAAGIWQIHPFSEGNTRATAVFMIKYMKSLGFNVNNEAFEKHSWYFRNALVRANYNNLKKGVHATTEFLEMFFSNLLIGTAYDLKNRYMHIDCIPDVKLKYERSLSEVLSEVLNQSDFAKTEKIIKFIEQNGQIMPKEAEKITGKSAATARRYLKLLVETGYIESFGKTNNTVYKKKS